MTQTDTDRERVHHDRKATTAADTWDDEPMDKDTALELLNTLREHGYDTRLAVEAKHEESAVVKTIDNQDDAEQTLFNIRLEEEYPADD